MICDLNENYCTIQGLIYISKPRRSFLRRLSRNDSILDSIRLWYNQYNAWRNDECSIVDCFVRSYTNGSLDRRMKDGTMPRGIVHSAGGERDQTESSDTATPPHPWRQRTSDPLRIRAEFRVVFFFFYVVSWIPQSEGAARVGVSIIDDGRENSPPALIARSVRGH